MYPNARDIPEEHRGCLGCDLRYNKQEYRGCVVTKSLELGLLLFIVYALLVGIATLAVGR